VQRVERNTDRAAKRGHVRPATPRNRCVRFVAGVTVGSRNTRFQAACWALPGSDLHRLIAPASLGAFAEAGYGDVARVVRTEGDACRATPADRG
jgi:hypothetical protein